MAYTGMGRTTYGQKPFADFGVDAKEQDRRNRGKQKAEELRAKFAKDLNNLTELLTRRISQYASSQDAGARQMAELYASYLDKLKDADGRSRAVRDYRKGLIPGIGAPAAKKSKSNRPALMPPAWS